MCAVLVAVISALLFITITQHSAYNELYEQLKQERLVFITSNAYVYGTILSVDAQTRTVTYQTPDPYNVGGPPLNVQTLVAPIAIIARQELLKSDPAGPYDSLSPATPAVLSDLSPGDHAMFANSAVISGERLTYMILFGNPL
jgi:hypothetical protein